MTTSLTFPLRWHTQLNGSAFYQQLATATLTEVLGTFVVKCPNHPLREYVREEVGALSNTHLLADEQLNKKFYEPIFTETLNVAEGMRRKVYAVERAARRFGSVSEMTSPAEVRDEQRLSVLVTLLVARELANGTTEVQQEASDALEHLIDTLSKGSPEIYDLAARLSLIICSPSRRQGRGDRLLDLLKKTARNFSEGAPEVYQLAGMDILRKGMQEEGPEFDIVTDHREVSTTVIHHERSREARIEGEVYTTIAQAFSSGSGDTFEEAASMALYGVDYFLGSGGKHYFVRPAALGAFLMLIPMIGKNARVETPGKDARAEAQRKNESAHALVKDFAQRLNAFINAAPTDPLSRPHEVDAAYAAMDRILTIYPSALQPKKEDKELRALRAIAPKP